jgi:hypothetical protein
MPVRQDQSEPNGPDEAVRARRKLTRLDVRQARTALKEVEDQLHGLFPQVTEETTTSGPRVLTPEMNQFVLLSAERARLRQTTRTR